MLFLGFGKRTYKVKGETQAQKCKKCSHERPFKIVEEKRWFTLFFIPLIPYKKRNLVVCSLCGAGYETNGEVTYIEKDVESEAQKQINKESASKVIKEQFDKGEISKNEYIRMSNALNFEANH